jgi:Zn-dependent protease with chaperone function
VLLSLRARAWSQLQQFDKVEDDHAEIKNILSGSMPVPPPPGPPSIPPAVRSLLRENVLLANLLFPLVACLVMLPVFFLLGRRQRRDAGGTWLRLLLVSVALAVLQTSPMFTAVLLLARWPELELSAGTLATFGLFVFNGVLFKRYLDTMRWQRSRSMPPPLQDAAVLDRIRDIAARMGLEPPMTRLVHSTSSRPENQAFISGLAAPTLLLHDGILYRLSAEERDAIIAHELAHLANHTFWYQVAAAAVCTSAVVVVSALVPLLVALAFGWAGFWGLLLLLSRCLELDCDRRAARAIGYRRAASALWKIHADQPFRGRPVLEFLIGATSTHPSRDERLAAIHRAAPPDDKPEIAWDPRLLAHRRLAAWSACGLWLAVLVLSLYWGYRWPDSTLPAMPLAAVAIAPVVLLWLGFRKIFRRRARFLRQHRPWTTWLARVGWVCVLLLLGFVLVDSFGWTQHLLGLGTRLGILIVGILGSLILPLFSRQIGPVQRLEREVGIAFLTGDHQKAFDLCASKPRLVVRSSVLRYNQALARALLGQRDEALDDLEQLRRDTPSFKMTWLALIALYGDEGEYERALPLARELTRDLPKEPAGRQTEAWLLRKLGRLDEAEQRARETLALEPEAGSAYVILAGVALDRGDVAAAREHLARAERLAPGTVDVSLLDAEITLATGDPNAEAAVQQALEIVRNTPLAFSEKQAAALARRLQLGVMAPPTGS